MGQGERKARARSGCKLGRNTEKSCISARTSSLPGQVRSCLNPRVTRTFAEGLPFAKTNGSPPSSDGEESIRRRENRSERGFSAEHISIVPCGDVREKPVTSPTIADAGSQART